MREGGVLDPTLSLPPQRSDYLVSLKLAVKTCPSISFT